MLAERLDDEEAWLDMAGVAREFGIKVESVRTMNSRAEVNRRLGRPKPGDLPRPERYFGQSPAWRRATIERYRKERPSASWQRGSSGTRMTPAKAERVVRAIVSVLVCELTDTERATLQRALRAVERYR